MIKRTYFFILVHFLLISQMSFGLTEKKSDLAGSWYPGNAKELKASLDGYLEHAGTPLINDQADVIAIIEPHAGLVYSGQVAAYGYALLKNRNIDTAIVIAFNHRIPHSGVAVCDFDKYTTPLGPIEIDKSLSKKIAEYSNKIYLSNKHFVNENSSELQLPFIQTALKGCKVVIIHIGYQTWDNCKLLADALYNALHNRKNYILISSTDMCHFLTHEVSVKKDTKTIDVIKAFDAKKLFEYSEKNNHEMLCGYGALCSTMLAARKLGATSVEILNYATSGDVTGQKDEVVGYFSGAIINKKDVKKEKTPIKGKKSETDILTSAQKKKMLNLARESIVNYLQHRTMLDVVEKDKVLNEKMGGFVTLHKNNRLRGCIGNIVGTKPFYITVRDMAVEAATRDPRFAPVTMSEMTDIDIEISALSPLKKIQGPDEIEVGKHGVLVTDDSRSGVYLPQVAREAGWNKEQFMNSLCGQKAGMRPDAWKNNKCNIYIFTAEVFGEK